MPHTFLNRLQEHFSKVLKKLLNSILYDYAIMQLFENIP